MLPAFSTTWPRAPEAGMTSRNLIRQALLAPQSLTAFSALDWDVLIRQGRRANLLARLACLLDERGELDAVPEAPRQHLLSAIRLAERQTVAVRWEIECIQKAFAGAQLPTILLKGAAYLAAGLPASVGRVFSDVDIIVPRALIADAESALLQHGWRGAEVSAYDQRFYRDWMHEIPPMTHVRRGTTIDLHHSILPETARVKVDAAALLQGAVPIEGRAGVQVLQPADMLLHSAAHLFHEGELDNGQRDLFDLASLFDHFGRNPAFWAALVPRARVLGLTRPLYYAVRYTSTMLGVGIPQEVLEDSRADAPPAPVARLMDFLYERALRPMHATCDDRWTRLSRLALYIRSHWMRLPLHLLVYHLGRKVVVRPPVPDEAERMAAENGGPR
ncbi:nucleotidyltransferase family protein [soil metagenome]